MRVIVGIQIKQFQGPTQPGPVPELKIRRWHETKLGSSLGDLGKHAPTWRDARTLTAPESLVICDMEPQDIKAYKGI